MDLRIVGLVIGAGGGIITAMGYCTAGYIGIGLGVATIGASFILGGKKNAQAPEQATVSDESTVIVAADPEASEEPTVIVPAMDEQSDSEADDSTAVEESAEPADSDEPTIAISESEAKAAMADADNAAAEEEKEDS